MGNSWNLDRIVNLPNDQTYISTAMNNNGSIMIVGSALYDGVSQNEKEIKILTEHINKYLDENKIQLTLNSNSYTVDELKSIIESSLLDIATKNKLIQKLNESNLKSNVELKNNLMNTIDVKSVNQSMSVYISKDFGITWNLSYTQTDGIPYGLATNMSGKYMIVTAGSGVAISTNGGSSWSFVDLSYLGTLVFVENCAIGQPVTPDDQESSPYMYVVVITSNNTLILRSTNCASFAEILRYETAKYSQFTTITASLKSPYVNILSYTTNYQSSNNGDSFESIANDKYTFNWDKFYGGKTSNLGNTTVISSIEGINLINFNETLNYTPSYTSANLIIPSYVCAPTLTGNAKFLFASSTNENYTRIYLDSTGEGKNYFQIYSDYFEANSMSVSNSKNEEDLILLVSGITSCYLGKKNHNFKS